MTEPAQSPNSHEDDRYEVFVKKFAHYEGDLRRFVRSLLPNWTDADEVVQQTAIVIWRKFDQFDQETNFIKWACVISRFEALALDQDGSATETTSGHVTFPDGDQFRSRAAGEMRDDFARWAAHRGALARVEPRLGIPPPGLARPRQYPG